MVQQGLDLLRQQTEARDVETEALRTLVAQRRGGTFVPADRMQDRVARMLDRKRREHDVAD